MEEGEIIMPMNIDALVDGIGGIFRTFNLTSNIIHETFIVMNYGPGQFAETLAGIFIILIILATIGVAWEVLEKMGTD